MYNTYNVGALEAVRSDGRAVSRASECGASRKYRLHVFYFMYAKIHESATWESVA